MFGSPKNTTRTRLLACLLSACALPGLSTYAQGEAVDAAADAEEASDHPIFQFLADGTVNIDVRFRYEFAEVGALGDSNAFTMRTRLGYTTPLTEGFQAMIELEDNRAADYNEYNAAGLNGQPGLSPIADPEDTELNQLWASYDFANIVDTMPLSARVGRQRINLDDQRFIGGVAWRQLEQTFDAARVDASPAEDLTATYVYIDEVNRIFGPSAGLDFQSDSHLVNVSYTGSEIGKIVGFAYLLDLGGAGTPGAAVSSQTYGVRLTGSTDIDEGVALAYAGSFAFQSDYANNAVNYDAVYVNAEGKLQFADTNGGFVGAGFEMLGSDNGAIAFSTPLATGHKFNGFADSFLATPAGGLRDYYVFGGFVIPEIDTSAKIFYHYFTGDDTSVDLGSEVDLVLAHQLEEGVSVLLKYAIYDGDSGRADIERFWLQLVFSY